MRDAVGWWHRLSTAGVLAVFAVAAVIGLRPTPGVALAARSTPVVAAPVAPPVDPTSPGAILAPVSARSAVASQGSVAYTLLGTALTLEDIPVRALAAYQRAATVIDTADDKCHLDWQLLAALGKVVSDHGRVDGSVLDDQGVPRPQVVGERLTGRHGTQRVADTDAGQFDGDRRVDRAVGPMMLLPSVWSVVSVDGDADGRRNPQDVDDAALAAAVFLCAGPGDLRNPAHRHDEIRRFHSGADYIRNVLSVRAAYQDAAATPVVSVLAREQGVAVDAAVVVPTEPTPDPSYAGDPAFQPSAPPATHPTHPGHPTPTPTGPGAGPSASGSPSPTGSPPPTDPSSDPSSDPTECPEPTQEPTNGPSDGPTMDPSQPAEPDDCTSPTSSPTATPTETPTATPTPTSPTPSPTPTDDQTPPAGLAVPFMPIGAGAVWLWRRRRRTAETDSEPSN